MVELSKIKSGDILEFSDECQKKYRGELVTVIEVDGDNIRYSYFNFYNKKICESAGKSKHFNYHNMFHVENAALDELFSG